MEPRWGSLNSRATARLWEREPWRRPARVWHVSRAACPARRPLAPLRGYRGDQRGLAQWSRGRGLHERLRGQKDTDEARGHRLPVRGAQPVPTPAVEVPPRALVSESLGALGRHFSDCGFMRPPGVRTVKRRWASAGGWAWTW